MARDARRRSRQGLRSAAEEEVERAREEAR